MAERVLNDQQKLFLEVLFGEEAKGDAVKAKKLAGYSDNYPTSDLIKSLHDEILDRTKKFLARLGPKAVIALQDILTDPVALGNKEKLAAAKDVLDRFGVAKQEKSEVTHNRIFILPPKKE